MALVLDADGQSAAQKAYDERPIPSQTGYGLNYGPQNTGANSGGYSLGSNYSVAAGGDVTWSPAPDAYGTGDYPGPSLSQLTGGGVPVGQSPVPSQTGYGLNYGPQNAGAYSPTPYTPTGYSLDSPYQPYATGDVGYGQRMGGLQDVNEVYGVNGYGEAYGPSLEQLGAQPSVYDLNYGPQNAGAYSFEEPEYGPSLSQLMGPPLTAQSLGMQDSDFYPAQWQSVAGRPEWEDRNILDAMKESLYPSTPSLWDRIGGTISDIANYRLPFQAEPGDWNDPRNQSLWGAVGTSGFGPNGLDFLPNPSWLPLRDTAEFLTSPAGVALTVGTGGAASVGRLAGEVAATLGGFAGQETADKYLPEEWNPYGLTGMGVGAAAGLGALGAVKVGENVVPKTLRNISEGVTNAGGVRNVLADETGGGVLPSLRGEPGAGSAAGGGGPVSAPPPGKNGPVRDVIAHQESLPVRLDELAPKPLGKVDTAVNVLKDTLGIGTPKTEVTEPVIRYRKAALPEIESEAKRLGAIAETESRQVFNLDKNGRIRDLAGQPTVQDLAAKLPNWQAELTPAQRAFMERLKAEVEPYGLMVRDAGVDLGSRPDIIDGGFYLPRKWAGMDGIDTPAKVSSSKGPMAGGKKGFEREAEFNTMVDGIEAGHKYAPLGETLTAYVRDAGKRIVDTRIEDYLKNVKDEAGRMLGETAAERVPQGLRDKVTGMRNQMTSLRGKLATAERQVGVAEAKAQTLQSPLERLQGGVVDRATAKSALADAKKELTQARRDAVKASREAGSATVKDQQAVQAFEAAKAKADAAYKALADAQKEAMGLGETKVASMGVRLPEVSAEAVRKAVENADLATRELRALANKVKMPVDAARANEASLLHRGVAEAQAKQTVEGLKLAEGAAIDSAHDLAPDVVFSTMRQMEKRIETLRNQGGVAKVRADSLAAKLEEVRQRYESFLPEWQSAKEKALLTPQGQGRIGMAGLGGRTYPLEVANAMNDYLRSTLPAQGRGTGAFIAQKAVNNILRGLNAAADISAMGIQGLLGAVTHPMAYAKAAARSIQALGDSQVLGKYLLSFDERASAGNRPTSRDWAKAGLKIGGSDTEFNVGRGVPKIGSLIERTPIIKQSNRSFGNFGDILRLEMADIELERAMGKGRGANMKTMREIARGMNLATGTASWEVGGGAGSLGLFAPRFFASQLELTARAVTDGSLTGDAARRMFVRLAGLGTLATVAANEASPDGLTPGEFFTLMKDGRMNPNFLRFRVNGRDYSFFGPWDSLLRGVITAVSGDPTYMLRTKASPTVALAWDLFSGKTFTGEDARTPEAMLRRLLPFSLQDAGSESLGTTLIGMTGVKSSPVTAFEKLDARSRETFGKPYNELDPLQRAQMKDETGYKSTNEDAVKSQADTATLRQANITAQEQIDEQGPGQQWRDDYHKLQERVRGQIQDNQVRNPFTGTAYGSEMDKAIAEWGDVIDTNTYGVNVDWDAVDKWMAGNPDKASLVNEYLTGKKNTDLTPMVTEYKRDTKALSDAGYFDYKDELWAEISKNDTQLSQFPTYYAWRGDVEQQIRSQIDPGTPKVIADRLVEKILGNVPVTKIWTKISNSVETGWIAEHPKLAGLAYKWGYLTPTKAERVIIASGEDEE